MFIIRFTGTYGTLYLGKGWGPEHQKVKAVRFATKDAAEARLASVREIMTLPANSDLWLACHMAEAVIVETR